MHIGHLALAGLLLGHAGMARADDAPADEAWAVHGQSTVVLQGAPAFASPYVGPQSFRPGQRKETFDATMAIGVRPWRGLEMWIDPEVDQGFGLSNTLGVAGYVSGEAYKVGKRQPYLRVQRFFLRQTIDLGGDREMATGTMNQLAGPRTADRLVVTIGKFGAGDVFDTNRYAHDPRGDFFNWSIIDTGSFDYAADAWGYTLGAAAEWYRGPWTVRVGALNLSKEPNGATLETGFGQYQLDGEVEHRHTLAGHDGAVRVTVFRSRGRFGRYDDAIAAGGVPDTDAVRRRRTRSGVSANLEQAVSGTVGLFARAGIADGAVAPYDFTDIDRTLSAGMAIAGEGWGRAHDTIGLAGVVNAISRAHRRYLAAGGLGLLIGDGQLARYGAEAIGEAYYDWKPIAPLDVTFDYQLVARPGYNRARGPANVIAVRLHGAF